MEVLNKVTNLTQKRTDVKIIYLPPATIALTKVKSEQSEQDAYALIAKFAKDTELLKIKPDERSFGFNFYLDGAKGYTVWATIPDEMEVFVPFIKSKFPGGLFACHSRAFKDLNSDENSFLRECLESAL